jgi:hypothetical protein
VEQKAGLQAPGNFVMAIRACKENVDRGGGENAKYMYSLLDPKDEDRLTLVSGALESRALASRNRVLIHGRMPPILAFMKHVSPEQVQTGIKSLFETQLGIEVADHTYEPAIISVASSPERFHTSDTDEHNEGLTFEFKSISKQHSSRKRNRDADVRIEDKPSPSPSDAVFTERFAPHQRSKPIIPPLVDIYSDSDSEDEYNNATEFLNTVSSVDDSAKEVLGIQRDTSLEPETLDERMKPTDYRVALVDGKLQLQVEGMYSRQSYVADIEIREKAPKFLSRSDDWVKVGVHYVKKAGFENFAQEVAKRESQFQISESVTARRESDDSFADPFSTSMSAPSSSMDVEPVSESSLTEAQLRRPHVATLPDGSLQLRMRSEVSETMYTSPEAAVLTGPPADNSGAWKKIDGQEYYVKKASLDALTRLATEGELAYSKQIEEELERERNDDINALASQIQPRSPKSSVSPESSSIPLTSDSNKKGATSTYKYKEYLVKITTSLKDTENDVLDGVISFRHTKTNVHLDNKIVKLYREMPSSQTATYVKIGNFYVNKTKIDKILKSASK